MTGIELKLFLKDNPHLIEKLLEEMGCDNIDTKHDKIVCSNPDGDNVGAVNVMLNDTLNCFNYTRPDYQIKYEIRDIITLVQFFLGGISLDEAKEYIKGVCGINNQTNLKLSNTVTRLKKLRQGLKKNFKCTDKPIDESEFDNYIDAYINYGFLDDGISTDIQEEFQLRYDLETNRAILPIRNSDGELITFKGRTLYRSSYANENKINKYIYTHRFTGKYYLYGEYENREYIKNADEIFIFEAEKSVLQAATFGVRNCVAVSKKDISRQQMQKLISYGKPVVIAFDKDVKLQDVINQCKKFIGVDVYYIYDTEEFLSGKMSPTDDGEFTFEMLTACCKYKFEKGEW